MSRLLGFGTFDESAHPRIRVLLDGMADRGWQVSRLNRPLGFSTAERVEMLQKPWRAGLLAARLADRWTRLALGSLRFRGAAAPDAVMVGYMGHFDVLLARLLFPRTPIVLDHLIFAAGTASDRGAKGTLLLSALRLLDRIALGAADVIVVDTAEHRARLTPVQQERAVIAAVGAPEAWFEVAHGRRSQGPLRIVFFGLFTPLQGTPTIARALRRLHDRDVPFRATLIGSGQDHAECRRILEGVDEVQWVPWVDGADLPALVADHDVCLGITGTTPKAADVVPNKVYQGIAARCVVVTSDTAPQRRILADAAVLVPAGDDDAMASALQTLANDSSALDSARERSERARDRFRPHEVVADLEARLCAVR